ncbi:MAG: PilZ domain-containing protein [Gemmatimonadetes bacterium]|nr:PilZ domain-containing protein [Gemmatimonadota bacterium]
MSFAFDRATYRIPYPPQARPRFYLDGAELEVVDCSESGLRFVAPNGKPLPEPDARLAGQVRLLSKPERLSVEGQVLRCYGNEVAMLLDKPGIPLQAIFGEQRYLARRFPARYR